MATSIESASTTTLLGFSRLVQLLGGRVGELHGISTVHPVHRFNSFHYDKDRNGIGKAADINWGSPGVNPPAEKPFLLRVMRIAESMGLAVIHAAEGTYGPASTHKGHLHVDVGIWSYKGGRAQRVSKPRLTTPEYFTVDVDSTLTARKATRVSSRAVANRKRGYVITAVGFEAANGYLWARTKYGNFYALCTLDGKTTFVKAGKK